MEEPAAAAESGRNPPFRHRQLILAGYESVYAPGDPKQPRQSVQPKLQRNVALNFALSVSKSLSTPNRSASRSKYLRPFGQLVMMNQASVSVR
jgi:hypothetical protein